MGPFYFTTHLRNVCEQNRRHSASFLTRVCPLAPQCPNLAVCFPSVKLNIACYFLLLPQTNVRLEICKAIFR